MRRMTVLARLLVLTLGWSFPASTLAGNAPPDPCDSPRTVDMEKCLNRSLAQAEADLQHYLARVRNKLIGEDLAAFEAAQKAWLVFVEADCRAVYEHYILTPIRVVHFVGCKLGHTNDRVCHLASVYFPDSAIPSSCGLR